MISLFPSFGLLVLAIGWGVLSGLAKRRRGGWLLVGGLAALACGMVIIETQTATLPILAEIVLTFGSLCVFGGTVLAAGHVEEEDETHRLSIEDEKRKAEEERMAVVGRMSSQVAHNLFNPLAAILNTIGYLRRAIDSDLPHWPEPLDLMAKEVELCRHIVHRIAAIGHEQAVSRKRTDLAQMFEDALDVVYPPPTASVELKLSEEPFLIDVDPLQFQQVITNLIRNGLDAAGESGTVILSARRAGTESVITITDDGPGIDKELRQEIFALFFTTRARGSGLGLSVAERVVRRHGGTLTLASAPGEPTTFEVRLPARGGDSPPSSVPATDAD